MSYYPRTTEECTSTTKVNLEGQQNEYKTQHLANTVDHEKLVKFHMFKKSEAKLQTTKARWVANILHPHHTTV